MKIAYLILAHANIQQKSGGIRSACESKWGTDYEMVEYCIENQTTSRNNINRRR